MSADLGEDIVALLPRLRRFALGLCRSADEADDLVQATCERALAAGDRFVPGTRLDMWLFRILRNLWLDSVRKRRRRGPELELEVALHVADPRAGAAGETRHQLAEVARAVHALPPDQRDVLLLVCVEEFSYREAATILNVNIGTVTSRLARARGKIAAAMDEDELRERSSPGSREQP
jgi:RNA polymerase sigma-70 factor (ECF subfamily)